MMSSLSSARGPTPLPTSSPSLSSSASSSSALYTRSALLQWINSSLGAAHPTLDAVPAKAAALILNAVHGHSGFPLNRIEFSDLPTLRDAQLRNCETVVSQAASHLGYSGRLSPALWAAKEDSANELLFWRWVRQSAEGRGWNGTVGAAASVTATTTAAAPSSHAHPGAVIDGDSFLVPSHTALTSASVVADNSGHDNPSASRRPPRSESNAAFHNHHQPQTVDNSAAAIAARNARHIAEATAAAPPIGRDAAAYHASMGVLEGHLLARQQQQQQLQLSGDGEGHEASAPIAAASAYSVPTDPYIAAIIDAKTERLQFLQSVRSRLIAACHAKDRSKVIELMCEYTRGGPMGNAVGATNANNGGLCAAAPSAHNRMLI